MNFLERVNRVVDSLTVSTMQVLEQTFGVEVKVYDDCCHFDDWKPNQETLLKEILELYEIWRKNEKSGEVITGNDIFFQVEEVVLKWHPIIVKLQEEVKQLQEENDVLVKEKEQRLCASSL